MPTNSVASALSIARHYGKKYAEGGMTLKRTEPFPEAPEGYEYYAPAEAPAPTPEPEKQAAIPTPDWAADEYGLQRQQAEALPQKPESVMEPDLTGMQTNQVEGYNPEKHIVDENNIIRDRETWEPIQFTRRTNVSPITKTPQGQYEWNMPKIVDILGNMGGGWSAPVSGAETILGAGMRVPRRPSEVNSLAKQIAENLVNIHGHDGAGIARALDLLQRDNRIGQQTIDEIFNHLPPEARTNVKIHDIHEGQPEFAKEAPASGPLNLNTFFMHASPSEVEHLTANDLAALDKQLRAAGPDWVDYAAKNPDLWEALKERLHGRPKEIPLLQDDMPSPQRDFQSLDELEKAYERVTQPTHFPEFHEHPDYAPLVQARIAAANRMNNLRGTDQHARARLEYDRLHQRESEAFREYGTRRQEFEAQRNSGDWRNQSGGHPNEPIANGERLSVHEFFGNHGVRDVERLNDTQLQHLWGEILNHQSANDNTWHNIDNYQPELVERLRSEIRARRYQQPSLVDEIRQLIGEAPPNSRLADHPPQRDMVRESYDQAISRQRREREEAFNTNYATHIAPHFGDKDKFLNTYFAGKHSQDMDVTWTSNGGFRFEGPLKDAKGNILASISRDFDPVNKTAHHGYWRVNSDRRGEGLVPTVLKNQIDVYNKLGIERVMLNANIDVGSYAWAKYGWVPTQTEWHHMANRFKGRLAMFLMGSKEKEAVLEILNNPNPKAIWLLADSTIPKSPGSNMTVGKALMLNGSWNGTLHLKDPDSMARFNEYVAKKIEAAKKGKDKDK